MDRPRKPKTAVPMLLRRKFVLFYHRRGKALLQLKDSEVPDFYDSNRVQSKEFDTAFAWLDPIGSLSRHMNPGAASLCTAMNHMCKVGIGLAIDEPFAAKLQQLRARVSAVVAEWLADIDRRILERGKDAFVRDICLIKGVTDERKVNAGSKNRDVREQRVLSRISIADGDAPIPLPPTAPAVAVPPAAPAAQPTARGVQSRRSDAADAPSSPDAGASRKRPRTSAAQTSSPRLTLRDEAREAKTRRPRKAGGGGEAEKGPEARRQDEIAWPRDAPGGTTGRTGPAAEPGRGAGPSRSGRRGRWAELSGSRGGRDGSRTEPPDALLADDPERGLRSLLIAVEQEEGGEERSGGPGLDDVARNPPWRREEASGRGWGGGVGKGGVRRGGELGGTEGQRLGCMETHDGEAVEANIGTEPYDPVGLNAAHWTAAASETGKRFGVGATDWLGSLGMVGTMETVGTVRTMKTIGRVGTMETIGTMGTKGAVGATGTSLGVGDGVGTGMGTGAGMGAPFFSSAWPLPGMTGVGAVSAPVAVLPFDVRSPVAVSVSQEPIGGRSSATQTLLAPSSLLGHAVEIAVRAPLVRFSCRGLASLP